MTNKLKPIVLAFSGLIVYSALCTVFGYIFSESVYIRLVSDILTIILGGLYLKTVIRYPTIWDKPSRNVLITALITMVVFVFTSMFTSEYLLSECINDEAFAASVDAKATLSVGLQVLSIVVSVCLAPITEEIVFRGFMYRQLTVFSKPAALVISSLVFALYHGTLIHLYTAFLGGIILGCIYEKTQQLRYSIFAHILFNGLTLVVDLFDYPDFFSSIWFVIPINVICVAIMVVLFRIEGIKAAQKIKH